MARKMTVQELMQEGVTKEQAERIVERVSKPLPREIVWCFKGTEEVAAKVSKAAKAAGVAITVVKRFKSGAAKAETK